MTKEEIAIGSKLIAEFMGAYSDEYKVSTIKDINGKFVKEGDIINADGYNSDITGDVIHVHCVEYDKERNLFGSDIYGDFDALHAYKTIEVIGHAEQFRELYETDKYADKWSGNLGSALKSSPYIPYEKDWNLLMLVIDKIEKLRFKVIIGWTDDEYFKTDVYYDGYDEEIKLEFRKYANENFRNNIIHTYDEESKLFSVYKSVIEFIKWNNKK